MGSTQGEYSERNHGALSTCAHGNTHTSSKEGQEYRECCTQKAGRSITSSLGKIGGGQKYGGKDSEVLSNLCFRRYRMSNPSLSGSGFWNIEIIPIQRIDKPAPCIAVKLEGLRAATKEAARAAAFAMFNPAAWQITRVQEL
jgi:hypothetical protein